MECVSLDSWWLQKIRGSKKWMLKTEPGWKLGPDTPIE
jgi:hypothetical protein